jgi:hypothetical protein
MVSAPVLLRPPVEDVVELDDYYTAFYQVEVPSGTSAIRAWQGKLQPFRSDDDARNLLAALENGSSISCDQGFLHCGVKNSERSAAHWAKPFLVSMALSFEVLILERPEPMHPVAFSLRPEISWYRFPGHPHLRFDIPLQYRGRTLHGLCVYSAADFRTRRLEDFAGHILYHPKPGEMILDTEPQMQARESMPFLKHPKRYPERVWRGHWPGKSAPAGSQLHLATIRPGQECWCGSGEKYGVCHRKAEASLLGFWTA